MSDLYHPRALFELIDRTAPDQSQSAQLPRAVSSASDRPYTTPDAWLYRDLFNGTYGWPPA
ncbi:MAG: hypothetical protein R3C53_08670 [Pirellulaceae bacterium]